MSDAVAGRPGSELLLYQTEDGRTRLEVRLEGETVWLTQRLMAELFQRDVRTISDHVRNLFAEGELQPEAVVRNFRITGPDGKSYDTRHYNLDVIISVGYRVKSPRGTQFRIWATQRLREYVVKGFTLDDERLKRADGGYFDELLARIRDIRSSEKLFRRKVLDIYATSIDYDPRADAPKRFFASVQNKMHWAAHGHTAAEIIAERADATRPNMGLTAWSGARPRKADVAVAKNYLTAEEIEQFNLIVSLYLDFAELQARRRRPMSMQEWVAKLDDFLRVSEADVLTHAGRVSHDLALARAEGEFEKFRAAVDEQPSPVERHFLEAVEKTRQLEQGRRGKAQRERVKPKRAPR